MNIVPPHPPLQTTQGWGSLIGVDSLCARRKGGPARVLSLLPKLSVGYIVERSSRPVSVRTTGKVRPNAGRLFAEGSKLLNLGSGVKDHRRGVELLKQAAKFGYVDANIWLGFAYDYGLGTRQNRRVALKHYQTAAEAGDANAQYHVGVFFH